MIGGPVRRSLRDRTHPTPHYLPPLTFTVPNRNKKKNKNRKCEHLKHTKRARTTYDLKPDATHHLPRDVIPTPRITTININDLSSEACTIDAMSRRGLAADYIEDLLAGTDILAIQETGLRPGNKHYLQSRFPRSRIIYNNSSKLGTAGTMLILSPEYTKRYAVQEHNIPGLEGYVHVIKFLDPTDSTHSPLWQLYNVYLHTSDKQQEQLAQMKTLLNYALTSPHPPLTYITGDFNFVHSAMDTTSTSDSCVLRGERKHIWGALLTHLQLMEVTADFHTRFKICQDAPSSESSRLDRFYIPASEAIHSIYTPKLDLVMHRLNSGLYHNAYERKVDYGPRYTKLGGSLITDHLPLKLQLCALPPNEPNSTLVIPRWIAECPAFEERFLYHWTRNTKGDNPFGQDQLFTSIATRAASETLKLRSTYLHKQELIPATIGLYKQTQIKPQNLQKCEAILSAHPLLRGHVYQLKDGRFVDDTLREYLEELLLTYVNPPPLTLPLDLGSEQKDLPADVPSHTAHVARPKAYLAQVLKKTLPSDRARLTHLRMTLDDEPTDDPNRKACLVHQLYSEIWKKEATNPKHIRKTLENYTGGVIQSQVIVPTLDQVFETIRHTNNSCAGPNGIPFSIYRRLINLYAPIAHGMLLDLARGCRAPSSFNEGLLFLLPKGDSGLVNDTRPLSVTNTNNRIIASAVARSIQPTLGKMIGQSQIGFLHGRSSDAHIENVTEIYYQQLNKKQQGYLLFLDIKKAFDQVHHDWLIACLKKQNFPPWLLSLVQGLLHDVRVNPVVGQKDKTWINIERGVKQGCCLSPLLFLCAIDPLIRALEKLHPSVFAYADDIAIYFTNLRDLESIANTVRSYENPSGLFVNGSKSGLLPTLPPSTDDRTYLHQLNLWPAPAPNPSAKNFGLLQQEWEVDNKRLGFVASYTYLGILIGADIQVEDIFMDTVDKAILRINKYGQVLDRVPLYRKIQIINIFVLSLFSYKFRFYSLPPTFYSLLKEKIRKQLTHFNGGAFGYTSILFPTANFGLKNTLRDLWAFNTALLASRSALIHTPCIPYMDLPGRQILNTNGDERSVKYHRDAAATDVFEYSRTSTPTLNDSETIPLPHTDSPFLTKFLTNGYWGDAHRRYTITLLGRRLLLPVGSEAASEAARLSGLNRLAINKNLPSHLALHLMYLLTNSLVTSHRMKDSSTTPPNLENPNHPCFICDASDSRDSLEHFYSCRIVHAARIQFLHNLALPTSISLSAGCDVHVPAGCARALYIVYFTHLAFSLPNPAQMTKMAAASICFSWAAWQGRTWSIDNGAPLNNFLEQTCSLALTTFTACFRPPGTRSKFPLLPLPHHLNSPVSPGTPPPRPGHRPSPPPFSPGPCTRTILSPTTHPTTRKLLLRPRVLMRPCISPPPSPPLNDFKRRRLNSSPLTTVSPSRCPPWPAAPIGTMLGTPPPRYVSPYLDFG